MSEVQFQILRNGEDSVLVRWNDTLSPALLGALSVALSQLSGVRRVTPLRFSLIVEYNQPPVPGELAQALAEAVVATPRAFDVTIQTEGVDA